MGLSLSEPEAVKDGEPVWQPDDEPDGNAEEDTDSDPDTHAVTVCVRLGEGDALRLVEPVKLPDTDTMPDCEGQADALVDGVDASGAVTQIVALWLVDPVDVSDCDCVPVAHVDNVGEPLLHTDTDALGLSELVPQLESVALGDGETDALPLMV